MASSQSVAEVLLFPGIIYLPDRERTRVITKMEREMDRVFLVKRGRCTFVKVDKPLRLKRRGES